jgi:hypothetical protein
MGFHTQSDFVDLCERFDKLIAGDRLAVDLDALSRLDEVRGCVEAGAETGDPGGGFNHGAGGSFAVGSRYVDCVETILRIPEGLEGFGYVFKAELGGFDFIAERVEVLD